MDGQLVELRPTQTGACVTHEITTGTEHAVFPNRSSADDLIS